MVGIWLFHCRGPGSIPGQGTEIPQAVRRRKKKKKRKERKKEKTHIVTLHLDEFSKTEHTMYSGPRWEIASPGPPHSPF